MKTFVKLTFMWIGSFIVALGFVYGAGTLIINLTQKASKGDVITSDGVNAVNSKLGTSGYEQGGLYGICRVSALGYGNSLPPMSECKCPNGFTRIAIEHQTVMNPNMGKNGSSTIQSPSLFTCYKN